MGNTILFDTNWGVVSVRNIMIDLDGSNLEEGVEIISQEETFEPLQLIGFDVNDLEVEELNELIEGNL